MPDIQHVLQNQQIVAEATADINAAVRTFSSNMAQKAQQEQQQAFEQLQTAIQNNDAAQIEAAGRQFDQAAQSAKDWGIGGSKARAVNAVSTVITGALGGQSGLQTATNTLAPYAAETIGKTFGQNGSNPNEAAQLLSHALLAGIVAATNGGDFGAGAAAGAGSEAAAKAITRILAGEEAAANPNSLSEDQKATIRDLSAAVGAFVGGVAGDSALNAQIGGAVGKNAVENNYLTEKQVWAYAEALKEHCQTGSEQACIEVKKTYSALDAYQRSKLTEVCTANPQTRGCADLIGGAQSGDWAIITESDNYPQIDPSKPGKEALHLLCGSNQTCRDEITRQDLRNNLDQLIIERDPAFLKRTADGYRNGTLGKILDFRGMNDREVIDHAKAAMYASVGMIGSIGKSKIGNQWVSKSQKPSVNAIPGTVYNQQAIKQLENGKLPGYSTGGKTGVPREMAPSSNPNAMAEDFVKRYIGNRQYQVELIKDGKGVNYKLRDGTYITYRPGGVASSKTSTTTATVEINNEKLNLLNLDRTNKPSNLKLKFPIKSEVKK